MKYSSLAACLAVVIAITMIFGSMGGVSLYVDGQALDENGVAVYSAASAMSARGLFGIQIEAELRGKTEVTTSEGDVYIYDIETQEALEGKFEAERVMIIWDIIPEDISKTYVLTIENSRGATEVTLLFNETAGWTICSIEK